MSSLRGALPAIGSIAIHIAVAALVGTLAIRRPPPADETVQIAVVDVPPPVEKAPPPEPPKPAPLPPKPVPMKIARTTRARPTRVKPPESQPPPPDAPPPPTHEAATEEKPVVLPGITFESTTTSASTMAVPTGNTLSGDPGRQGRDPSTVKPYKAAHYATSSQVTEMVQGGCDNDVIHRYYPEEAKRHEMTGAVVMRLLIDSDGSVAKASILSDPGDGLGPAALQTIRDPGCKFSPAKLNGEAIATTITFIVHFTLD